MLSKIREFLEEQGTASMAEIALHLDADPDAVRGMLDLWIAKGRIEKLAGGPACRTCTCHCDPERMEFYRWRRPASSSRTP